MNWLYILVLVAGVVFILYQLFFNAGGNAKFKSDLPASDKVTVRRKRMVLIACFSILCVIFLGLLIALLISLL